MMKAQSPNSKPTRPGAITPLVAILMVFFVAVVAFAVDLGYIILVQSDLQNAADSAALAGAHPLMDGYVKYNLPNQSADAKQAILNQALADARAKARAYAGYNSAGDAPSLTLRDQDIEFGFTNAAGAYTPLSSYSGFPNTIKVLLRRDTQANGEVALFFAPVVGTETTTLTAGASATIYGGVLDTLNSGQLPRTLPMTYDIDHWNHFLATGEDPDGNTSLAANGRPELLLYPGIKYAGNFGQLALDSHHAGSSEIKSWIDNGLSPSDIASLQSLSLIPLSAQLPDTWKWVGNPGMKSSTIMAVNDYVGGTYLLPLYRAKNSSESDYQAGVGEGSHYYYNIEAFVAVTIMQPDKSNGEIVVQPGTYVDVEDVFDPSSIAPAGTSSTVITTFVAPKLSE
jgi:Flp pilus assembly protein TadG